MALSTTAASVETSDEGYLLLSHAWPGTTTDTNHFIHSIARNGGECRGAERVDIITFLVAP